MERIEELNEIGAAYAEGMPRLPAQQRMSAAWFWWHCRTRNTPLHLRAGADRWRIRSTWTLEDLISRAADVPVTLASTPEGVFDYNVNTAKVAVTEQEGMPFARAAQAVMEMSAGGAGHAYIQQQSINEKFPMLAAEVDRPQWLDPAKMMYEVNLWLGSRGCFSPLHFDMADNFLVQLRGRKLVMLFDKRDHANLYPNTGQQLPHCSQVDVRNPDLARYPLYADARPCVVLLEAGDALYIPKRWWHAVHSIDLALSVNYWWGGPLDLAAEGGRMIWTREGRAEIAGFFRGLRKRGAVEEHA